MATINEVLQWLVIVLIFVLHLTLKSRYNSSASVVKEFFNRTGKEIESQSQKLDALREVTNNNSTVFAEEIAELQEELEIKNDEQIH